MNKCKPGDFVRIIGPFWEGIEHWDYNKVYKVDKNYRVYHTEKLGQWRDFFSVYSRAFENDWELAMPDIYED